MDEPVTPRHAAQTDTPTPEERPRTDDISGVDNMLEEGAPLEPADLRDVESGEDTAPAAAPDAEQLELALAERTADLQRLQAEYLNYKRRVDRDRELVRENATYTALAPIVEVLDTIDRARESARSLGSELEQGFSAVADQLERVVANAGLVKYGAPGDAFDPRIHEALSHIGEDAEVEVTTCKVIAKAGYRIGERVVRAAQVLVVDPAGS
ncbi:nucleotide exchange factor GrpE [Nocardioides sp.]|uniref:nucleotide exchange factor GrpE n=1 Tax=Nocardioides sp. TaxID=35761 RepID=UPI002F3F7ECE